MNIVVDHVDKFYGKKKVLNDFSTTFEISKGNIYGLVGPNGAGKTTLMKTITGLLGYSNGKIKVDNDTENNYIKWCKGNIAFIPAGERGLRNKNNVYDNVMYYGVLKGKELSIVKKNYDYFADLLNFNQFSSCRIEQLSTGQKKKAGILCGLCCDLQVLILDEPSSGLDIDAMTELKSMLENLSKQYKTTIIISSHDTDLLSSIANKYVFIFNGENVYETEANLEYSELKQIYFEIRDRYIKNENN